MQKITDILKYVEHLEDGILKADEEKYIIELLRDGGWDELRGSSAEKTTSDKLYRAENMRLEKPFVITFELERHGRNTNNLSTRSDLHRWKIDLNNGTAEVRTGSYRQNTPRDKIFKATERADEVSAEILNGEEKDYLIWNDSKTECKIKIESLVTGTNKQTIEARRKKFRENLNEILKSKGWQQKSERSYWKYIRTVKNDQL